MNNDSATYTLTFTDGKTEVPDVLISGQRKSVSVKMEGTEGQSPDGAVLVILDFQSNPLAMSTPMVAHGEEYRCEIDTATEGMEKVFGRVMAGKTKRTPYAIVGKDSTAMAMGTMEIMSGPFPSQLSPLPEWIDDYVVRIHDLKNLVKAGDNVDIEYLDDNSMKINSHVNAVSYVDLNDKPKVNGVELNGNKTSEELKLASKSDLAPYAKKTDLVTSYSKLNGKPSLNGVTIDGLAESADFDLPRLSRMHVKREMVADPSSPIVVGRDQETYLRVYEVPTSGGQASFQLDASSVGDVTDDVIQFEVWLHVDSPDTMVSLPVGVHWVGDEDYDISTTANDTILMFAFRVFASEGATTPIIQGSLYDKVVIS